MTTSATSDTQRPYRWVILLLCWAAFTMTSVDRATWGPAASSVGTDLKVGVAALGLFATTYYIGYVLSNAYGGFLADWLGSRLIVGCSILLSGSCMFAFGEATSTTTGLVFQALVGLCAGAELGGGVKLIAAWFAPERRGFAMGVFLTATSLGLVIANAVVPSLIAASSWRTSYHLFGAASVVVGVLCLTLLRPGRRGAEAVPDRRELPNLRPLVHNRNLILLGLAGFGALWGTYGFVTWSNLLMVRGVGVDPVRAGMVVVIFGAVAICSKPLVGIVADWLRISHRTFSAGILLVFAATLMLFSFATDVVQFLWIAPILGIAAYSYSPLMLTMIPAYAGERLAGSATGTVNALWQLGSAIVPTVIGMVFGATHSFQIAFFALAAGPLLAIIPLLAIREPSLLPPNGARPMPIEATQ
jgi:ACS family glucarate transporter-like MFS transporter